MSLDPKNIATQVALRTLQLAGVEQVSLQTSYLAGLSALDGAEIPASALADAVVAMEGMLADVVAGDGAHPYRQAFYARSEDLPSGEVVPSVDEDNFKFIGVHSGVLDSADERPIYESSKQEIERFLRRGNYTTEIRKYAFAGGRIYHTRDSAFIEGCSWDRTRAYDRLDPSSTQKSPIPTAYESVWVAGAIGYLVQEGWLANEGSYYSQFAANGIALIKSHATDVPSLASMHATADPVTN